MNLSPENNTASSGCKPLDETAFRRELTKLYPNCLRFARSLTRDADRAADAVQEAMLAIFEGGSRPNSLETLTGWLLGVVKNRVYRASSAASATKAKVDGHQIVVETFGFDRAEQPDDRLEAAALLAEQPEEVRARVLTDMAPQERPEGRNRRKVEWTRVLADEEDRRRVMRHIGKLTEAQATAVRLVVIERMTVNAAADLLGCRHFNVRQNLEAAVRNAARLDAGRAPKAPVDDAEKWKELATKALRSTLLTPAQRRLCEAMIAHDDVSSAARALGVTRTPAYNMLGRIAAKVAPGQHPKAEQYRNGRRGTRQKPDITPRWPTIKRGTMPTFIAANANAKTRRQPAQGVAL